MQTQFNAVSRICRVRPLWRENVFAFGEAACAANRGGTA